MLFWVRSLSQKEKEDCGFRYSKEDETFSTVNPNIYAKLILRNYRLMYHDSGNYYVYHAHCWRPLSDHKIKQVLREFFHKFEDNKWKSSLQSTYMSALPYECRDESQLKSAENYINVKNGLLDLSGEKTKIKQHNSNIFSTTQIPITYDPDAQCPKFEEYLNVTFQGDKDLIKLVQQIMGYCLSRTTKAHKMFIFLGSGSNGKSRRKTYR